MCILYSIFVELSHDLSISLKWRFVPIDNSSNEYLFPRICSGRKSNLSMMVVSMFFPKCLVCAAIMFRVLSHGNILRLKFPVKRLSRKCTGNWSNKLFLSLKTNSRNLSKNDSVVDCDVLTVCNAYELVSKEIETSCAHNFPFLYTWIIEMGDLLKIWLYLIEMSFGLSCCAKQSW